MNEEQDVQDQDEQATGAGQSEQDADGAEPQELDRLGELVKELEEVRQHVLYAQAETQNVRRRLEQEKQNAAAYATTNFARDILSVKDNLERALAAVPEDQRSDEKLGPLVTGIEATARELESALQRNGITRIESLGQALDPHRHQAMLEIPSDEAEPGTIVQEMQAGYMIKDRLLRPALVGVARKP